MKDIILETAEGRKIPVIFPDILTHSIVAGAMQLAIDTLDPKKDLRAKQCESFLERSDAAKPVGAGFIRIGRDLGVGGHSESLHVESRGTLDEAIIAIGEQAGAFPDDALAS